MVGVEGVQEALGLAAKSWVSASVLVDVGEGGASAEGLSLQVLASSDLVLVLLSEADGSVLELLRSAAMMVMGVMMAAAAA